MQQNLKNYVMKILFAFEHTVLDHRLLIDGSSAWLAALPILNDTILINALSKQKRPELDAIKDLYDKRNLSSLVCDMLQNCWQDDDMKRSNTEAVRFLKRKLLLF